MNRTQPPQAQINVDLSQAEDIICENCGNYTFNEVVLMKKLSALISPTGKEAVVPIPTFACNACGFINKRFLPTQMSEQAEKREESTRPSLVIEK
jgi:uncharacterized Zn finger protein